MPVIHPFRAWYYNPKKIPDLDLVISPPYDVISKDDQNKLYDRSAYNFARIILPKEAGEERYFTAAATLDRWVNEAAVIQDINPAIYLIEQTYFIENTKIVRTGIIAELELEPLGQGVLPHEQTLAKHINDRYRLMEETRANTGQIFMSYRDENRVVEAVWEMLKEVRPWQSCQTDDGVQVRLWAIRDTGQIHDIREALSRSKAIIADGHHRYKTALQYQDRHPEVDGSDRVMVTLVNSNNPGMQVLPTHRIINGIKETPEDILARIENFFTIDNIDKPEDALAVLDSTKIQFGLIYKPGNRGWVLTAKNQAPQCDVAIFHDFVLKEGFRLDTTRPEDQGHISYLRGTSSPKEFIANEEFEWLGLVNPPTINQIFDIAESGSVMPQKSTYFYPKMFSGLLFRRF